METSEIAPRARRSGYGQFCPVAIASEVLAEKWTPLVLRELLAGSHRFNDIRRGVPLMSGSLLSQRLRNLENWGLVERVQDPGTRGYSYKLTEAGRELGPIIDNIGLWGLKHLRTTFASENLDPSLLMWDMRRWIRPDHFPRGRAVILIDLTDTRNRKRSYWLVKEEQDSVLDLCLDDPGFDIDLTISADIETLARVWMGDLSLDKALRDGRIEFDGSTAMRLSVYDWIGLSPFARMREDRPQPATR